MFTVKNTANTVFRCAERSSIQRTLSSLANNKLSDEIVSTTVEQEWHNARPYSDIPRPSKFGLICSFLPGGKHHSKSITEYALMSQKELGDLFVMPGIFGKSDMLMVCNPDDIEKVYRTEGIYPSRNGFDTVAHFREVLRKDLFADCIGLITSEGEDWGNQRKILNPIMLQPRNARLYTNSLIHVTDEFIQRIRDIRDPITNEVPANFMEDLTRLSFESFTSIALNKHFGLIRRQKENPEALQLLENVAKFFFLQYELEIQPSMWKTIRTPKYYKMMRCQEEVFRITEKLVNDALTEIGPHPKTSVRLNQEPSVLEKLFKTNKKLAIVMTMDLLLAGVDATTTVLAGILLNLSTNPAKQDILRKEIISVLPHKNSELTTESMNDMPYLRACIKESLRFYPVSSGNFRKTGQDIVLNGYQIPKGTKTLLNCNLMLLDPKYYSRPREYLPERWLRRGNKQDELMINDNSHPFSFIPFGFGPRNCAGKRIVNIELEVCLLKLLRNFKVAYNYSTENVFRQYFGNVLSIPLSFEFTDTE